MDLAVQIALSDVFRLILFMRRNIRAIVNVIFFKLDPKFVVNTVQYKIIIEYLATPLLLKLAHQTDFTHSLHNDHINQSGDNKN